MEDEARLGLKPITRRVWAPKGLRPVSNGKTDYAWLYVYGFAQPATGRLFSVFLPRVKTALMSRALAAFAAWADPANAKLLIVVVDNAGWHVAKKLVVPPNVVLHRLPPCTPELQPAEPLWPLVREAVANRGFDELGEMEPVLVDRCRWLIDHPEVVRGAVGFGWAVALKS